MFINAVIDHPNAPFEVELPGDEPGSKVTDTGDKATMIDGSSDEPFQIGRIMSLLQETAVRPHSVVADIIVDGQNQRLARTMEKQPVIRAGVDYSTVLAGQDSGKREREKGAPGRIVHYTVAAQMALDHLVEDKRPAASWHGADDGLLVTFQH